jgi:bifunctional non-homologous end joining protein LigD
VKVKPTQGADFVIGGYTQGKGSRAPLGAILVGYWEGGKTRGKLRYASHVGSGFDERTLAQVTARLRPLERSTCPFTEVPEQNAPTTWVEPKVVAEVSFHSWTDDDHLRAPVFLRLRDDIDPKAVRALTPGARRGHRGTDGRPDRRDRRAARNPQGGDDARGGTAPDPPDASRSRLLAGESRAEAAGAHQARSPALLRASLAVHAARILPIARSR